MFVFCFILSSTIWPICKQAAVSAVAVWTIMLFMFHFDCERLTLRKSNCHTHNFMIETSCFQWFWVLCEGTWPLGMLQTCTYFPCDSKRKCGYTVYVHMFVSMCLAWVVRAPAQVNFRCCPYGWFVCFIQAAMFVAPKVHSTGTRPGS